MHTLALDIGNTAVKAGAFDGPLLREMAAGLTAKQVRELVQRWQPQHVVVASVVGTTMLVAEDLRDLVPGEMLDGEGGYCVWANAIPARRSLAEGGLPIGLAHHVKVKRPVAKDAIVRFADVEMTGDADVVALRREMEDAARPMLRTAE